MFTVRDSNIEEYGNLQEWCREMHVGQGGVKRRVIYGSTAEMIVNGKLKRLGEEG